MLRFNGLSAYKVHRIISYFCEDISASSASELLKINRNTINLSYKPFRELIFHRSFSENSQDFGVFELEESYFGARRVRGKRGRGAAGKTPVFGLLKREGKVFVSIVPNCSREELLSFKGRSWTAQRFIQRVGKPPMDWL